MSEEEARLRVVVDPGGAESGASIANRSIMSIGSSWLSTAAILAGGDILFQRLWAAGKRGADVEETFQRLDQQMRVYTGTAQNMIQVMQNASNGQLNMANSAQLASRALAMGLSPDSLSTFTQAADLLGDVMGTDLKTAFDSILQGLATGRTQMLANIGVHLDLEKEVKNLAVSTNRTTEQITKQERAAIAAKAVMEQLQGQVNKFASDTVSDADKMTRLEAKFQDLQLQAERFAKTMVLFTVDTIEWGNSWVMQMLQEMGNRIDDLVGKAKSLKALVPDFMLARSETTEGGIEQEVLGRAIVADTQGRLARNDFAPNPQKIDTQLDPKLQQIMLAGQLDRMRAALDAQEKLRAEYRDQEIAANQDKATRLEITEVELAKRTADTNATALREHIEFINERMAIEKSAFEESKRIGFETTEEKFAAEQKFSTTFAALMAERLATRKMLEGKELEGARAVAKAERDLHTEEEAWLNEHRALQISLDQQRRAKAFDDEVAYFQALKSYREFNLESEASILEADLELTRANLAKKTELTQEEAGRLMIAWQNHEVDLANMILNRTHLTEAERSTIRLQYLQESREKELAASNDVAEGWVRGMRRYIKDTQSGFGMAADMARRTAQMMEQSFGKFFFDAMEGRIQSFKDVMKSLLDFTKQIMSQIMGQLITQTVLKGVMAGFGGGFGQPGADVTDLGRGIGTFKTGGTDFMVNLPGMASGGITNGLTLAGEAGPEAVVPLPGGRSIPVQWTGGPYQQAGMMSTMSMPVTVNVHNEVGGEVETTTSRGSDGNPQIDVYIKNVVKQGMRNGEFDQSMKQFGSKRQPVRR